MTCEELGSAGAWLGCFLFWIQVSYILKVTAAYEHDMASSAKKSTGHKRAMEGKCQEDIGLREGDGLYCQEYTESDQSSFIL